MALFGLVKKKSKSQSSFKQTQDVTNRILGEATFERLFAGAGAAASAIDTGGLGTTAQQLFTGGSQFLQGLQEQAAGGGVAGQFLTGRISGDEGLLEENIAGMREDLGRLFSEEFLPAIRGQSIAAGQLGGGRQGVAEGAAQATLAREFQRGTTALRTGELAARQTAAQALGAQQLSAAQAGFEGSASQFGLAEAGALAGLTPFAALAQIVGQPTILSTTTAQAGSSKSKGSSTQIGAEFQTGG